MNHRRPHLPLPSDREAHVPAPPQGTLTARMPGSPILEVSLLDQGGGLRLVGELCFSSVGDLLAMLDILPEGADVLDVGGVFFMDSSGLHAFEQYARRLEPRPLVLQNPSPQIRRLFELTGADLNPDIELRSDG